LPHGWIILDKPLGLGSTQAVAAVKRNLRAAGYGKVKVGHGGTLDPLATGVLPIALGEATKLAGRMLDASKVYEFTIRFGEETDTLDLEGCTTALSDSRPALSAVQGVLSRFTGPIEQVPPAYSALMVDGTRAYDLARKGEDVVLKARGVTVYALVPLPFRGGAGGGACPPNATSRGFDKPHPNPSPEGEGLVIAHTRQAIPLKLGDRGRRGAGPSARPAAPGQPGNPRRRLGRGAGGNRGAARRDRRGPRRAAL
jgi:tRNA pseudouridine55 synthase